MSSGLFAVAVVVVVSAAAYAQTLAAARPGLDAVPLPRLEGLEPAVAKQVEEAQRAVEQEPGGKGGGRDLADAYSALAQVCHAYEFFECAEPAYRNANRLAATDVRPIYLLGYLYQQTGRFGVAAEHFEAVLRLQPTRREAAARLAEVYLQLDRLRESRELFESLLEVFPAIARSGLGHIALRERRYQAAVGYFRDVLARVPDATSLHYPLAMAYRGLGRMDEARLHLERRGPGIVRLGDQAVAGLEALIRGERGLVMQGRRAFEAGEFTEAAALFGRAVAEAPGSLPARVNLGLALLQAGEVTAAGEQFAAAVGLDPHDADANAGLGFVRAREGRDREAIDYLGAAFDRMPANTAVRRELLAALLRERRDDEAIALLRNTPSGAADDEATDVSLAILLASRERFRDAIAILDAAHRQFPERTATATTLARLLAASPDRSVRDGARALAIARVLYEREASAVHAETVALALAELSRCDEAREWMKSAVTNAERLKNATEAARLRGTTLEECGK